MPPTALCVCVSMTKTLISDHERDLKKYYESHFTSDEKANGQVYWAMATTVLLFSLAD